MPVGFAPASPPRVPAHSGNRSYDAMGRILQWTANNPALSGSQTYAFGYDGSDEVISAALSNTNELVNFFAYGYDAAENRASSQMNSAITTTGVNALNELTSGSGGGPMLFTGTLDQPAIVTINGIQAAAPSLLSFSGSAPVNTETNIITISATNPANQTTTHHYQITVPAASGTYSYDLNGNLTADGVNTYEWDAANRLAAVNEPGNLRSQFTYDGLGRRAMIVEENNGVVTGTTNLLWCGTQICEARDENNNVTKRYYPQGVQISGTSYYYTRDHLGSVRELTGTDGAVLARYDYDPYGQQTELTGTISSDFGYTGFYLHQPSGLELALYRGYSPGEGRWISRDPSGEHGGINLYGYVRNNPVYWTDRYGLWPDATHMVLSNMPGEGGGGADEGGVPMEEAAGGVDYAGADTLANGSSSPGLSGGNMLPDNANVVRGGTCTADRFANGSGVTLNLDGTISGVSVNSANGVSVADLSGAGRVANYGQVGVSTVGDVRAAGGEVVPSPSLDNPYHATLSGLTPEAASDLFTPTIPNPSR